MPHEDEFEPYVVYRVDGAKFECALWQMPDGNRAIALFLTSDSAMSYRLALALGDDWNVFRPAKPDLAQIFRGSLRSGITQAVLDPDLQSAQIVFDVKRVLSEMGV